MICHCLLIETNDGLALVDTGFGTEDIAHPGHLGGPFLKLVAPRLDTKETALAQIEALGYSRRDVRHILVTHLDLDHAGGLPDFPDARVHIYLPEHEAAMARATLKERERYKTQHWAHGPAWRTYETAGEPWFGFPCARQLDGLPDDILIIPVVGHTRGHAAIAVKSDRGWLVHAGDAYFFHEEMNPTSPRCTPALAAFQTLLGIDDRARRSNQARLRELVRSHGDEVTIFSAHDPVELAREQRLQP